MAITSDINLQPENSPIYKQIERDLRARIRNREWSASEMLPSRRTMAVQYGVDVNTLQRALLPLLQEGLLRADAGRGTFVSSKAISEDTMLSTIGRLEQPSEFTRQRSTQGLTAGIFAGFPPEDDWLPKVINSFEVAFSARGGQTRFFNRLKPNVAPPADPWISVSSGVDYLLQYPLDVLLLFSFHDRPGEVDEVIQAVGSRRCEFINVGWDDLRQPINQVFYDNEIAGYQAAQHLFDCGHRKITFFSPVEGRWVDERFLMARRAAVDAGLTANCVTRFPETDLTYEYTDHVALGYKWASRGFSDGSLGEAIISANDGLAVGLLKAAEEAGKTAGVDFSIIGFDDAPKARILGLSTMRPPLEALGIEAARLAERAVNGGSGFAQVRLSSHLILRNSTAFTPKHVVERNR